MQKYIELFKSLADETRLKIILLLLKKERCVCEIEAALNLSQVKVSRHLTILRYASLVNCRREGTWIYYSISNPKNKIEEELFKILKKHLYREKIFFAGKPQTKICASKYADK